MNNSKKILVVGAGIGGQSAAIALKQVGADVDVIEILPAFDVYGVGIIQQANALRALDALGVAEEAMRLGSPYGKVKMCLAHGVQVGEAGTPPMGKFPSHNGISRRTLHEVLLARAKALEINYLMNTSVAALVNTTDGVEVTFSDGQASKYDLVIGADGINSQVRSLVFGKMSPNYVGLSVWRYAFKRPAELDTGYIFFGKKSKLGIIPMTADTCYMFVVSAEGAHNPIIPQDNMVEMLKNYMREYPVALVQGLIDQVSDANLVNYRPLETLNLPAPWFKDSVLIIGDGAHATIPQLGSGAALAIEDAVVLGEEVQKGGSSAAIFERFMDRRYKRCKMVVDVSETLGQWELLEFSGQPLPEGANVGMLMGKTTMALTEPI